MTMQLHLRTFGDSLSPDEKQRWQALIGEHIAAVNESRAAADARRRQSDDAFAAPSAPPTSTPAPRAPAGSGMTPPGAPKW